jgi:nucleolar protein 56
LPDNRNNKFNSRFYGRDRRDDRRHDFKKDIDGKRQRFMRKARSGVSTAYVASAADHSIIQAINAYNELERVRNTIYERLEEWYGAYFPNVRLENHDTFARLVSKVSSRDVDDAMLVEVLGNEAQHIADKIRSSTGFPSIDIEEYKALKELAEYELRLADVQKGLDAFIEMQTKKVMPNIVYLIDYKIAAEMLSKAGSLDRLANMPASTIQLLGAERALFKHMKYGSRPPKYGFLFKLPELAMMNKKDKGRMARIYATKICIAARADAISKRFIADALKEQIQKARKRNNEKLAGGEEKDRED